MDESEANDTGKNTLIQGRPGLSLAQLAAFYSQHSEETTRVRVKDREKHKESENRRRTRIRDKFAELRVVSECQKKDRCTILSCAIQQITYQKKQIEELERRLTASVPLWQA